MGCPRNDGGSSNGDPAVDDDAEPDDETGDGSGLSEPSIGIGGNSGDALGDGRSVSGHGSS